VRRIQHDRARTSRRCCASPQRPQAVRRPRGARRPRLTRATSSAVISPSAGPCWLSACTGRSSRPRGRRARHASC
jgi:hypothetical protein